MSQLQRIFNYQGRNIRTVLYNEEPWFVAKDVCNVLDLTNPSMALQRLDEDERAKFNLGRQGVANIVNESGLYELIFASRKLEAKMFKKWVKQEVLPSIRKHGAYATPQTIENIISDPDFGIQLLTNLKEERDKRLEAERTIEQQRPKVVFAESCLVSQDTVLVKDVAKLACNQGILIGQNKLYNKLREWGYIQKNNTQPTQRAIESGYFQVLQRNIQTPEGSKLTRTTKVTTKGQLQILNRLKREQHKEVI